MPMTLTFYLDIHGKNLGENFVDNKLLQDY